MTYPLCRWFKGFVTDGWMGLGLMVHHRSCMCTGSLGAPSVLIRLLAGHLLQLNRNLRQESTHTRCDFQAAPCLVAYLEQTDDNWKVNFSYGLWIWFPKLKFQGTEEKMIYCFFISFALPIQDDELWIKASDWEESNLYFGLIPWCKIMEYYDYINSV